MNRAAIKLLSFDLDNTLYDNGPVIEIAETKNRDYLAQVFKEQNIEFDFNQFMSIRNELMKLKAQSEHCQNIELENLTHLRYQVLKRFCKPLNNCEQVCQQALAIFLDYRSRISVPNEIMQLLSFLKERFIVVSVSNGNCDPYLTTMGDYLEKHYAPHHGFRAKPHKHMLEEIKRDFHLESENILHIGDQWDTDGKAAENANCPFYHFAPFEQPHTVSESCEQLKDYLDR